MKKISIALFLLFITYFIFTNQAVAISPTVGPTSQASPTTKPTNSPALDQINAFKDRVASKVAELKLVDRRGIIGTVTGISSTQLTLTDVLGNTRFVDVDELTKFASDSAKDSFGISDITKGETLGILGLFNKQSKRIMARFVEGSLSSPTIIHGAISSVDKVNFAFVVTTEKGTKYTVDVENLTKTQNYTKAGGLVRAGFSKLTVGEHVIVIAFQNVKDKTRHIGSRILLFPEIPASPKISLNAAPQETIVPSTGSGKKLTPITR